MNMVDGVLDSAAFVQKAEALFETGGIALLDAKPNQCRWPARSIDGVAQVCGAPKYRGAYCLKHSNIAYLRKVTA